ncbi:MAG: aminoacyl-tRNA hydrolase [Rickettsiaceae bacterium]|jgi:PTH1 family peptidyl-tRNA hydrolase|nr:aminoacyl-tRNA hydrolase [Rickettsiaceae bacterium]
MQVFGGSSMINKFIRLLLALKNCICTNLDENMFLFVGLGNPGKEYEKTRHSIGFMVIDNICNRYGFSTPKTKFQGIVSEGTIDGQKVITLKPTTYMNRSGQSVAELIKFYKIPLNKIIVFHDEIDLLPGKIRVKTGGGAGGHNGLKDLDAKVGKEYKRVRIGVGHPGEKDMVADYVLNNFAKDEQEWVDQIIHNISANCSLLLKGDDSLFMTKLVS